MSAIPVSRRRVSLRGLAWRSSYNRHLLTAAIVAIAAVALWRTIDPPARVTERIRSEDVQDRPAELFAAQYAKAFLSFDAQDGELRTRALGRFGAATQVEDGYEAPARGRRTIRAAQVLQSFSVPQGTRYVLAAESTEGETTYLSVTVARDRDRALQIVGSPAIVGPPVSADAAPDPSGMTVGDQGLRQVVTRTLRNYLSGAGDDLAADLASTATVSLPAEPMALEGVSELRWEQGAAASVLATAAVRDQSGQRMQLTYELALEQQQDRWLVAGIQNNPTGQ